MVEANRCFELLQAGEWVSKEDFATVVAEVADAISNRKRPKRKLTLDDMAETKVRSAHWHLDQTVGAAIQQQFFKAMGIRPGALTDGAVAAYDYLTAVDKLAAFGFPYAAPSRDLLLQTAKDAQVREIPYHAPAPTMRAAEDWEKFFYPEILGLYAFIFEDRPTASANRAGDDADRISPALLFVQRLIEELIDARSYLSFLEAARAGGVFLEEWRFGSPSALRGKVNRWIAFPRDAPPERKMWAENKKFFETISGEAN